MAKELKVMERRLRINPKDPSRIEYWHDGANKWMDDGGVPGNVEEIEYDNTNKACIVLYMSNGKKYRRDIYDGTTREIKESAPQHEQEWEESESKGGFSIFGKKKNKASYSSPRYSAPPSSSPKKSSSCIWKLICFPFKLIWGILKFIWKALG